MPGQRLRGIFLCIVLILLPTLSCPAESETPLEPIVISKPRYTSVHAYSLQYPELEELPFNSPVEALSILPVDLESRSLNSGIQTDFSLRGSTFQGVLMLLDGARINDPQTGHYHCDIPFTGEDIERAEVMPGGASSLFGPDAIGGAINFVTRRPDENRYVLQYSTGQNNLKSGVFSVSQHNDNVGLRVSLERQSSTGWAEDTDFEKLTGSVASLIDLEDGEFKLNAGWQHKDYGAFDFYTPGRNFPSRELTRTILVDTGLSLNKGGLLIKPNFLWRRHNDRFLLDETQQRSGYSNYHRTDTYTPNIYFNREAGILGKLGLGFEYGREQIKSTNLGKHLRDHGSVFIDDTKEIGSRMSVVLSGRMDYFDSFKSQFSGSANAKYNLTSEHILNASISRSIRIPSFTELYYSDPVTVGNSTLSTEKSLNYQAGYEYKNGPFSFALTGFFRDEDDFIDWVKTTPLQARWVSLNVTKAKVTGAETDLRIQFNKFLKINANYTYINKDIADDGLIYKYGPNYSKHLVNASAIFSWRRITQSFTFTYKKQPVRGGWFIFGTRATFQLSSYAEVFVEANNLLNRKYQDIVGISEPKRWVEGGLRLEW